VPRRRAKSSAETNALGQKPQSIWSDANIGALADRQHGVVATWQLIQLGMTERAIKHRVDTGRLHRIHRGVYAVGRRNLTRRGYWMAAVLAYGPKSAISHRTAAALHELKPTAQRKIDVTLPTTRRNRPTIRVHTGSLTPEETTTHERIRVTTVARTIVDLAAVLDPDQLLRVIEQGERMGVLDFLALRKATARAEGRPGAATLRQILATYTEAPPTRSELERTFLSRIEQAGLPRPIINATAAGLEVDFLWPEQRLIVELDGRAYHTNPRAFEQDRLRDATLLRAGYRVLRITYRRLQDEPGKVLNDVHSLLILAA
jgi:REase_MTES_1575/Transcriptional regulator, AbiEi antitoxin